MRLAVKGISIATVRAESKLNLHHQAGLLELMSKQKIKWYL
jgi:hypothetical protein